MVSNLKHQDQIQLKIIAENQKEIERLKETVASYLSEIKAQNHAAQVKKTLKRF